MKLSLAIGAIAMSALVLSLNSAYAAGIGDLVVDVNNSSSVKLNAADGSIEGAVPFNNPEGAVNRVNGHIEQSIASTTAELNSADAYRVGHAEPRVSQVNEFNPSVTNWTMDLSNYVQSVDAVAARPGQGGYLYAASASSSKIVVIDPAKQTVVTSFETAIAPRHVVVNPNGGDIYVADGQNPFVISYHPTGALNWVNLNLGGAVSNIAFAKGTATVSAAPSCGAPTIRIMSDRNSIRKGESATIMTDYGSGSLPPCIPFVVQFAVKTAAQNNVDFTFTDFYGQDATQFGVILYEPFTLTNLPTSRKKTLPFNILLLADPGYYSGNKKITVQLLAR